MNRRCLGVAVLVSALLLAGCERFEKQMIERAASRNLGKDRTDLMSDGKLHVILCGTGSPLADATRAGACTAVLAGNHFFVIDSGSGSWNKIALARLPRAQVDGLLLTHFHSDHIGDVGEGILQSWVAGRSKPLPVYGPPGVERVVAGFTEAYTLDSKYRAAHHGPAMNPEVAFGVARVLDIPAAGQSTLVFEGDGLRIVGFNVDHQPVEPAFGYRIEFGGRSVVLSGDTEKSANLTAMAKGADVLIHEALARNIIGTISEYAAGQGMTRWAKLTSDILDYHTSPVEAAEVARDAGVGALVFTHIVPPLQNFMAKRMFMRGVDEAFDGRIEIGYDLMHITLPPGSTEVLVEDLN